MRDSSGLSDRPHMLSAYRYTWCLRCSPAPMLAGGCWKMSGVLGSSWVCLLGGAVGCAPPVHAGVLQRCLQAGGRDSKGAAAGAKTPVRLNSSSRAVCAGLTKSGVPGAWLACCDQLHKGKLPEALQEVSGTCER